MEATKTKTLLVTAAIALLALAFFPATAIAASPNTNCTVSVNSTGFEVNPSNPSDAIPYTLVATGSSLIQKGALIQGQISGTLNGDQVSGGFSYNTASDKLLAKLMSTSYELNLAYVTSGVAAGFTFIGTIHIVGQQPLMLSTTTLHTFDFSCSN